MTITTMNRKRSALTLVELIVVIFILAVLAGLVVPMIGTTTEDAKLTTTLSSMKSLREAIVAYHANMKGIEVQEGTEIIPGTTGVPRRLLHLMTQPPIVQDELKQYNPLTQRGWRGPYLASASGKFRATLHSSFAAYGSLDSPAHLDGWGNPIVIQWPTTSDAVATRARYVRLVSAGPPTSGEQSTIDTDAATLMPTTAQRGNDIVLFIFVQDENP
jgi:type II secretory pathway pseudopilin PulG